MNLKGSNWEFRGIGSTSETDNSDDISSPNVRVKLLEISLAFVVGRVAHYLKPLTFLFEIIEDEFFSHVSDVGDSGSKRNWLFKPFSVLSQRSVFLDELRNRQFDIEFMWVRICQWSLLKFIHHLGPILKVSSWIKNFFFFNFFFFAFFVFCFFGSFSCLFCLFSFNSFLFLQSLLFVFTQLLFGFLPCFFFLRLDYLLFLFWLLLSRLSFISLHGSSR